MEGLFDIRTNSTRGNLIFFIVHGVILEKKIVQRKKFDIIHNKNNGMLEILRKFLKIPPF